MNTPHSAPPAPNPAAPVGAFLPLAKGSAPCDQSCPKCGNTDIRRLFRRAGTKWDDRSIGEEQEPGENAFLVWDDYDTKAGRYRLISAPTAVL